MEKVIKDKKEPNKLVCKAEQRLSIVPKVNKNDEKELNEQQLSIDPKNNKNNDNSCCSLCCCCCGSSAEEKDIDL